MSNLFDQFTAAVRDRDEATAANLVEYLPADGALVEFLRDEGGPLLLASPGFALGYGWKPATGEVTDLRFQWYGVNMCPVAVADVYALLDTYLPEATEEALLAWEDEMRSRGAHPDLVEAARTRAHGFGLRASQRRALETPAARRVNVLFHLTQAVERDVARAVFGLQPFAFAQNRSFLTALAREQEVFQ